MLPDRLFGPLDLDETLHEAYDTGGEQAVAATLAEALSDPRAQGDAGLPDYLEEFTEASQQADERRRAITVLSDLARREEDLAGHLTGRIAELHAQLGEHELARGLLSERHQAEQQLPAGQRSLEFYIAAASIAGEDLAEHTLATQWVREGIRLADLRDPGEEGLEDTRFLLELLQYRYSPTTAADTHAEWELVPTRRPHRRGRQRLVYRVAYLPEAEFTTAWARDLLEPTVYPRHEDYRRELEAMLQARNEEAGAWVVVMPLDIEGLLAYAQAEGTDPARRATRMAYNQSLPADRAITYPPGRNEYCWCGSKRKYKKCCGRPGFTQTTPPDPATTILRIELDGADPPVWRRVALPAHAPSTSSTPSSSRRWAGETRTPTS
jgi:hypothetical protein